MRVEKSSCPIAGALPPTARKGQRERPAAVAAGGRGRLHQRRRDRL